MTTLIFLPNEHLLAWVYHDPDHSARAVVDAVEGGQWPFPPDWRSVLDQQFHVPAALHLCATAHDRVIVIYPDPPLQERLTLHRVRLTPGQARVLALMAQGLTTAQIALTCKKRRRWVMYQVAGIKRMLGARTRAEAVKRYKE